MAPGLAEARVPPHESGAYNRPHASRAREGAYCATSPSRHVCHAKDCSAGPSCAELAVNGRSRHPAEGFDLHRRPTHRRRGAADAADTGRSGAGRRHAAPSAEFAAAWAPAGRTWRRRCPSAGRVGAVARPASCRKAGERRSGREAGAARRRPKARRVPAGDLGSFRGKNLHPSMQGAPPTSARSRSRNTRSRAPIAEKGQGWPTARFRMHRWN
jgi:hypothetical protein